MNTTKKNAKKKEISSLLDDFLFGYLNRCLFCLHVQRLIVRVTIPQGISVLYMFCFSTASELWRITENPRGCLFLYYLYSVGDTCRNIRKTI